MKRFYTAALMVLVSGAVFAQQGTMVQQSPSKGATPSGHASVTPGIEKLNTSNTFSIYSFARTIYVNTASSETATVNVYDISGRVIYTGSFSAAAFQFDMKDVPAGIYVVNVETKSVSAVEKVFIK